MTTQTLEQRFDSLEEKHNKLVSEIQGLRELLQVDTNNRKLPTRVSPKEVITLRNSTGLGLMACKDALERCQGDQKLAWEYLLKHCKGYK
jgi:hypothetical protein